jgi:hypothetical protein
MNQQQEMLTRSPCRKARRFTVSYLPQDKPGSSVPYLRLRGHWLNDAGFPIGQKLKVEVSDGRLTIEPVD